MIRRALRRKPKKDPVTPEIRAYVIARDGGCIAPLLGADSPCRDRWGNPLVARGLYSPDRLEIDHIRLDPGGTRRSVPAQLVTGCAYHHRDSGWMTAHRPEIRAYLDTVERVR